MKIFVTGGAGYIGSICVEQLLNAGHSVTVFDNLTEGHRRAVDSRAELILGDLPKREVIGDALRSTRSRTPSCISPPTRSSASRWQNPSKYFRNNVCGRLNLLDAMVAAGVKRFVFSSTCATFGPPDRVPIDETLPQRPINPYGESKLIFEKILRWYDEIHGLQFVALRYFNAAGASEHFGEDHRIETHLIPNVLKVALGQKRERPDLRHRLRDAGRHLHPRLHSHPRSWRRRTCSRSAREQRVLQSRHRRRHLRREVIATLRARHREKDRRVREEPRRPGDPRAPHRRLRQDPAGARLDAAVPVHRQDHRERLGVAPAQSGGLRRLSGICAVLHFWPGRLRSWRQPGCAGVISEPKPRALPCPIHPQWRRLARPTELRPAPELPVRAPQAGPGHRRATKGCSRRPSKAQSTSPRKGRQPITLPAGPHCDGNRQGHHPDVGLEHLLRLRRVQYRHARGAAGRQRAHLPGRYSHARGAGGV